MWVVTTSASITGTVACSSHSHVRQTQGRPPEGAVTSSWSPPSRRRGSSLCRAIVVAAPEQLRRSASRRPGRASGVHGRSRSAGLPGLTEQRRWIGRETRRVLSPRRSGSRPLRLRLPGAPAVRRSPFSFRPPRKPSSAHGLERRPFVPTSMTGDALVGDSSVGAVSLLPNADNHETSGRSRRRPSCSSVPHLVHSRPTGFRWTPEVRTTPVFAPDSFGTGGMVDTNPADLAVPSRSADRTHRRWLV
ncbi:hypothetical protein LX90_004229 [Lentzea flava]|nr:hypothetical protein [Lentzea flava]